MRRIAHLAAQWGIRRCSLPFCPFVVPVFVDRHEYARAVVDYVKNPNSENNAIRRLERTKNQRIALRTPIVAAGVLFVLMNAGCFLVGQSSARLSKTV
jgi:hypothetical protein